MASKKTDDQSMIQKSGSKGVNYQAGRDIHVGVNLEMVQALLDAKAKEIIAKTETAHEVALERISTLSRYVLPFLTQQASSNILEDPDYIFNLADAQQSAARSSTDDDLRLLSDLLERRSEYPNPNQRHKMATRRAIAVVGQIVPEDLDTLVIIWYATGMYPSANNPKLHLEATAKRFEPFIERGLQSENVWQSELAVLDCINVSLGGLQKLKSFPQIYADLSAPGFFCVGMDNTEAEAARKNLDKLMPGLSSLIIPHPIEENRFILASPNDQMRDKTLNALLPRPTKAQSKLLDEVITLNKSDQKIDGYIEKSRKYLSENQVLKKLCEWWGDDSFPSLTVTSIGKVVAYSHFHRTLPTMGLPPLDTVLG